MGFRRTLAILSCALAPLAAGAQLPDLGEMLGAMCPRPLGDDPATPPTLRVAMLWRMPTMQEQMSGGPFRKHPSEALPPPGSAADARVGPRERLDAISYAAGNELLAGRLDAARQQLDTCLATAATQRDTEAEAACASNLGVLLAMRGRYADAQAQFERAATRYREALAQVAARRPGPPSAPGGMPEMAGMAEVLAAMSASMTQQQRMGPSVGVLRSALNLGQLAAATGQLERSERHLIAALEAAADLPGACRAAPASDLARLHRRLGRDAEAAAIAARHPMPAAPFAGQSAPVDGMAGDMGRIALAPAGGQLPTATPSAQATPEGAPRVLALNDEPMALGSEATLQALLAGAARDEQAGRHRAAADGYGRVALRAAALRRPDTEATARAGLMRVHAAAGQPGAAIAHGKRAVALVQTLHDGEAGAQLDRATRRTLLRQRQQVYGQLARLLVERQRLSEAEQVLQMLRSDEGLQFTSVRAASAARRLPETEAEEALRQRLERAGAELLQIDARRQALITNAEFMVGLKVRRAGLEQVRLQAAEDVVDYLRGTGVGRVEDELRRATGDLRPLLKDLMADRGSRLTGALREVAEDAARFSEAPANPAQRAAVAEAARRAGEFHLAFSPFFERLMREPALAGAAWRDAQSPTPERGVPTSERIGDTVAHALRDVLRGLAEGRMPERTARAPVPHTGAATPMPRREIEGAIAAVELAGRLWRLDDARERAEAAYLAAELDALATLERPAAPAVSDDSVALLARHAADAALLHFMPGETHTDVIVVTARGRSSLRLPLTRARIDELAGRLQRQLRLPVQDPRPVARELHDALLAPLRPQLDAAGVQVLVLSLQERLRFVPFAALHDGRGWLVERYALVVQPGARLADLLQPTSPRWRVAAFGASAGGEGLPPLPAVPGEVRRVVAAGPAASPTAAALPGARGQAWIDRAFDARALRQALAGQHQALHIASHFHFVPGDATGSFLLLGDGSRLSLKELGGSDFRFDRLELVALSACQTGLSEDDAYGQEVDGLGALLMAQGARAVLASLWQVADDSTGELMGALYGLRERGGTAPLPLAQALRQAQLAMIRDSGSAGSATSASRGAGRRFDDEGAAPVQGPLVGRAHPFHWAPFVLMGNWQ
jgi:CHAT domain-containing protein/tetratricopeptide (TPR) repeat protein